MRTGKLQHFCLLRGLPKVIDVTNLSGLAKTAETHCKRGIFLPGLDPSSLECVGICGDPNLARVTQA